jgi:excinuclease UvrABC nuclease subunit
MTDWQGRFDGHVQIEEGQSPEDWLDRIPARRGVALLVAEAGQPIVLLPAADMRARIRNRMAGVDADGDQPGPTGKLPDLQGITRSVHWVLTTSHFETDLAYFELARLLWPKTFPTLLAWKPAWFVVVDFEEAYPSLRPARSTAGATDAVGPFATGKDAERYIQIIDDAFDLCRDRRHLSQAPDGQRCAYAQMGRCLCPCDGTISSEEYRAAVQAAWRCARGCRQPIAERLAERMSLASEALEFEKAASLKKRLERLAELDSPAYRWVAPAEEFSFLLVEQTTSIAWAKVFAVRNGGLAACGRVDYPPSEVLLEELLRDVHRAGCPPEDRTSRDLRTGLVSRYLFMDEARRGLAVRVGGKLTAESLAADIEEACERLGLRRRRSPEASTDKDGDSESPEAGAGQNA